MKTGYSFFGEDGEEYSYLKPFWQEIEYSEETELSQINNTVPVCLFYNEVTDNSLFAKWIDELNVVFMRHGESSSSEERALISSLALRNKLFCDTQVKKKRTFLQKENDKKEALLRNIGMNEKQIEDFFTRSNEISSLKILYDSSIDEQTAKSVMRRLITKVQPSLSSRKETNSLVESHIKIGTVNNRLFLMFMQTSFQSTMK